MVTVTSGANVQATISGSVTAALPSPSATQTIVTKSNGLAGTSITTAGASAYTVTGGKTFYVTSISISCSTAGLIWEIRDGTSNAGTLKSAGACLVTTTNTLTFPSPIAFSTGVWITANTTQTVHWTINGYEA